MIVATKIQHQETVFYFKQTQRSLTVYFSGCSLLGWDTFTSPFTTPCTDLQCITRRHLSLTLHNELFSFGVNQGRASDRVRQKMGNFAAFSREIMRQERCVMRQIMPFF